MNSDRDGRRNNRGRGRYSGRGPYKRGRGHYYQHYTWKQSKSHNHNQYSMPPQKPPSPLPGTEEYRQRHIQQTSELIKKQLNIDNGGDTCDNGSLTIPNLNLTSEPIEPDPPQPSSSTTEPKKKTRKKRVEDVPDEEINVQDLYDKIIKHICSLSHSKKVNLIQQGNVGYDIALLQIQKQKQLELSRALRDMSKRPTQEEKDGDVINAIIPDIGIKLEDLPNSVIEELSKTLQVKFEDNGINLIDDDDPIENIFDFEYLNKAQDDPNLTFEVNDDNFGESVVHDFGNNSDFNLDDIDVSKSYLAPRNSSVNDSRSTDSYPVIRVKRDLFESRTSETGEKCLETEHKETESTGQEMSNIFSSQLQKNITTPESSTGGDANNVFNKIFESGKKSFISPLDDVRYMRNSPMLRKLPNQSHEQTSSEVSPTSSALSETPKRWKSPGEKKMINYEQHLPTSSDDNPNVISTIFQQMEEFNRCMSIVPDKQNTHPQPTENSSEQSNKTNDESVDFNNPLEKDVEQTIPEEIPEIKLSQESQIEEITTVTNLGADIATENIEQFSSPDLLNESIKMDFSPEKVTETVMVNSREISTMTDDIQIPISSKKRKKDVRNKDFIVDSKEMGTMTENIENSPSTKKRNVVNTVTIETQTPIVFNKVKHKNIGLQTTQKHYHNAEVQTVQNLQTKLSQTDITGVEIDECKTKCKSYSDALKKLRELDDQIRDVIEQKNKIYESIKFTTAKVSKRSEARVSRWGEWSKSEGESSRLKEESSKSSSKDDSSKSSSKEDSSKSNQKKSDKKREERPETSKHKPDSAPKKKKRKHDDDEIEQNKKKHKVPVSNSTPIQIAQNSSTSTVEPFKKPLDVENSVEKQLIKPPGVETKPKKLFREMIRTETKPVVATPPDDTVKYFDKERRIRISKECQPFLVKDDKLFKKKLCVELSGYPVSVLEEIKRKMKKNSTDLGSSKGEDLLECSVVSAKDGDCSNIPSDIITTIPATPSVGSSCDGSRKKTSSKVIDKTEYKGIGGTIFALESADDVLLAAGDNGILYFFNVLSKELLHTLTVSSKPLTSIYVSRSNEECLVYVGSLDEHLRIIDFNTKKVERTINVESGIQCLDICWGYVFMGSITGEILIYDIKKSKLEKPIKIYENRIYAIKATQEGARRVLLTSTKDAEVSVRDAMTGLLLRTMNSNLTAAPTVYTVLQDQNLVYCASSQNDVLVYSFQNGDLVTRYESLGSRRVVCMQIVGNLIYVGCFNGTVCVFHKSTHRYLGQMIRRGELLISMLIVKNKVIVGTKNNKLVSWDIPNTYLEREG